MCGFCGFTKCRPVDPSVIRAMTEKIVHRGPDGEGFYEDEAYAVGFRRLSIIDLEKSSQPMFNETGNLVLVFNGEIYNYRELRNELLAAGHTFATEGDGEVLLHGFEEWGEELPSKLRGMYAFVIYDKNNGSLFAVRDRFGIKPMYYAHVNGVFVFGSEIKCITAHPDVPVKLREDALDRYLSFQYAFPPDTFFEDIFCLPPAHTLTLRDGQVQIRRYWKAEFEPDRSLTLHQAADEIEQIMENSVKAHRISDVELGCFLSSGVDSAYVTSYMSGHKAFTVGFDNGERYNECHFAAETAAVLGLKHHTHLIGEDEFLEALPKVLYALDQPLADPSCVALYFVCKLAAEQVKVVLSGEGSDELFGGYRIYREPFSLAGYQKLPRFLRKAAAKVAERLPDFKGKSFLIRGSKTLEERFIGNAYLFDKKEKAKILKNVPSTDPAEAVAPFYRGTEHLDDTTRMQITDINAWMQGDILLKADRMSMAHSLELRVPFLDRDVFEVARRIPTRLRVTGPTTKYALRTAAARRLPDAAAQKPKLGFPVPVRVWLRQKDWYDRVAELFASEHAARFFRTDELMRYLDRHYRGKKDNSRKIWAVYVFLLWYREIFLPLQKEKA